MAVEVDSNCCVHVRLLLRPARTPDPTDGRGCFLVFTEHGLDALSSAAPAHVESLRRHFIDRLTPDDLAAIEQIARRLEGPPR